MTDAAHVRDAMARFNQVGDVTDAERDLAFANFQKAASHFESSSRITFPSSGLSTGRRM